MTQIERIAKKGVNMRLDGKVAIITGGGTGIGKATAILFADQGAKVVIANRRSGTGEAVVNSIVEKGGEASFISTDVSKSDELRKMVEYTIGTYSRIDILFNNAGITGETGPFWEISDNGWDILIRTNLTGHFLCAKYVVPHMLKQGGGVIVNMSSVLGYSAYGNVCPYMTSKAGIVGMTKAMALDLARKNIRVNCIVPGSIDTPMMWELYKPEDLPRIEKEAAESVPIGRVAAPEEIANAVLFLVSPLASLITGATLIADGGLLARIATNT